VGEIQPGGVLVVQVSQGSLGQVEDMGIPGDQPGVTDGPDASVVWIVDAACPGAIDRTGKLQDFLSYPLQTEARRVTGFGLDDRAVRLRADRSGR